MMMIDIQQNISNDFLQTVQELYDEYIMELAKSPYKYPSRHAAFAYDAIWTIALTLNRSISALKEKNETSNMTLADFDYTNAAMRKTFMKYIKTISFQGMSVSTKKHVITFPFSKVPYFIVMRKGTL